MKYPLLIATSLILAGAAVSPALSQDTPPPKMPPKTMGDEPGKLPSTGTMSKKTPEMGATEPPARQDEAGPKGPPKRMGDEPGKQPPTGTVGGNVPKMTTPKEK